MKFLVNEKTGKVPFIMVAGADHVSSEMPLEEAEKLYAGGTKRASNRFPGYPVCVDSKYFLAGACTPVEKEAPKPKRKRKKDA